MIYGNVFLPKKEESASILEFGIHSVVYDEYCVYNSLLENCTDEATKPILESQVQILYEVSIKDIFNVISKAISFIIKKIKELIKLIQSYISKVFKPIDIDKTTKLHDKLKSFGIIKEEYILESSKIDKEYHDFIQKSCDIDIFYFKVGDYYINRTSQLKELDDAMVYYTKDMKDSEYFNKELIDNFNQFKDKYYKGNKETEYSLYKSDKIKSLLSTYTDPDDLIKEMINIEKNTNKLKGFDDLFKRIREIKESADKEKELKDLSNDLEKRSKKLESLVNEIKTNLEKKEYNIHKDLLSEFNDLVKFNINCYNHAANYLKVLSTYVASSYTKAKEITDRSYGIMRKMYYIVDKERSN